MDDELELMPEQDQRPFSEVLDSLLGSGSVQIPLLFRLSDMANDDRAQFDARWAITDLARRQVVARHMADLSEENFQIEFSPLFQMMLADADVDVKLAALDGLWDTTNTNVVRPIIDILESTQPIELRKAAAGALAHFVLMGEWGQISSYVKDRVEAALLAQYLNEDNADVIRCSTLEALGSSGNPKVSELIAEAYDSAERRYQLSAVFAMGSSADDRWIGIVIGEMDSPYYEMRAEAARAAGEIGSEEALSPLAEMVFDEEDDVQIAAIHALGKLGTDRAKEVLQSLVEDKEMDHMSEVIKAALGLFDLMTGDIDLDDEDFLDLDDEDRDDDDRDEDDFDDDDFDDY